MKREKYAFFVGNEKEAKTARKLIKKSRKLKYDSEEFIEVPGVLFDFKCLVIYCTAKKRKHFDKVAMKFKKELGETVTLF